MRQSAPRGDWSARSSHPHKKHRGLHHNGNAADLVSEESGSHSLSSEHAAMYEHIDPLTLDARLAEAEGHIAFYQAEAASLRKTKEDRNALAAVRRQVEEVRSAREHDRQIAQQELARCETRYKQELQAAKEEAGQLRKSLDHRTEEVSQVRSEANRYAHDLTESHAAIKALHEENESLAMSNRSLEQQRVNQEAAMQSEAERFLEIDKARRESETLVAMRDRELRTKDEHLARMQEQFQLMYGELKTQRETLARQQNAPWLRAGPDGRVSWPALLSGDQLAHMLKRYVPVGRHNATRMSQNDLAAFFGALQPYTWTDYFMAYGPVNHFIMARDEFGSIGEHVFYQHERPGHHAPGSHDVAVSAPQNCASSSPLPITRPQQPPPAPPQQTIPALRFGDIPADSLPPDGPPAHQLQQHDQVRERASKAAAAAAAEKAMRPASALSTNDKQDRKAEATPPTSETVLEEQGRRKHDQG
ncbi:hypothetical protein WJX73_010225 [Symbiochloris irregularis]|uniref:Uncharacterized protein n=1 Tax=Symbiochloris irregularis TaxID=706552 RepID=A0AAW1NVT4_9CHLO